MIRRLALAHASKAIRLAALSAVAAACGPASAPAIDLLETLPRAERRAAGPIDDAVRTSTIAVGGDARPSLVTRAPARITWSIRMPARARLRTAVALVDGDVNPTEAAVIARIGISGGRAYETLLQVRLTGPSAAAAWQPIELDLSGHSGWQWSLFYRPGREAWDFVLAADRVRGGTVAWSAPVIDMTN